jgi:hypothetical protein
VVVAELAEAILAGRDQLATEALVPVVGMDVDRVELAVRVCVVRPADGDEADDLAVRLGHERG